MEEEKNTNPEEQKNSTENSGGTNQPAEESKAASNQEQSVSPQYSKGHIRPLFLDLGQGFPAVGCLSRDLHTLQV